MAAPLFLAQRGLEAAEETLPGGGGATVPIPGETEGQAVANAVHRADLYKQSYILTHKTGLILNHIKMSEEPVFLYSNMNMYLVGTVLFKSQFKDMKFIWL